ncbi:archease [Methylicorpusculum sp.]|uniref:archease n=1 Tax=Methylicorpusculum sp. TaxID=2713644 RepID=UPI002AB82C23|nr:archease [Methylicorpusculum sp.]MDZ4152909.1 archease [Methylicorpusculum sp.]
MKKDFELLSHTADIKLRVYAHDRAQLLRHALMGMFQSVRPQVPGCAVKDGRVFCKQLPISREVSVQSGDFEALLVDFLSEALYLSDVHNEAYFDATIHAIDATHVRATLRGAAITGFEVTEIKAVTYHDLVVRQESDGSWVAEIVFDI